MNATNTNRKVARRRPPQFELVAGALCLDFVNTLDDRFSNEPKELLKSYVHLARFCEDAGILHPAEVDHLVACSQTSPDAAARSLSLAIEMREAMFAVFAAIIRNQPVPKTALTKLSGFIQGAAQHAQLVPVNGRFQWRFANDPLTFEAAIWPIARSAAELLTSEQLVYVRTCASSTCQWFFLDTSKNHRRRWCDMTKCGNRAKFRRFYRRKKKAYA